MHKSKCCSPYMVLYDVNPSFIHKLITFLTKNIYIYIKYIIDIFSLDFCSNLMAKIWVSNGNFNKSYELGKQQVMEYFIYIISWEGKITKKFEITLIIKQSQQSYKNNKQCFQEFLNTIPTKISSLIIINLY